MASFGEKISQINKNEFIKIVDQNIRLKKELFVVNKCIETLITFKSFVGFISDKFKNNLNSNEWQKFEKLRKDVEEVLKSKDKQIKTIKDLPLISSENYYINKDNCGTDLYPLSSKSVIQQSLNPTNKNSAKHGIHSNNGIKTNENTIHSSEDNMKTTETLYSDNEMTPKALYKSNITYNRRKQSNNCSQNTGKSVTKLNESTEEMTDPTTTQTIKTEIISNDKTEENSENINFEYLSQNMKDFENTYNSLNLSESQFSTKDSNDEQNIGFVDTNDSEEQTINCLKDEEKKLYNIYHELEGPVIVNIKPSNSSTDPKINSVYKCPIIGCNKWMTIDFIPKHSLEIHNQFVIICGQNNCKKVFTSAVKYDEHKTRHHTKDKQWLQFLQDLKNGFICHPKDCDKVFTSEEELVLHKQEIHFISKIESEVNNRSNNTSPVIMCSREDCLQTFEEKLFKHHMIVFHKECTSVECLFTDCSQKFNEFEEYMNHLLSHSSEFWYKYYPKIYYDLKVYKKHFIFKNESINDELRGNDSKKCDICGKVLRTKFGCKTHKKNVHVNKPRLECDWPGCEKSCKNINNLREHMKTHTRNDVLDRKCNICGKVFLNKNYLYKHKNVHIITSTLECDYPGCAKKFKYQSLLTSHKRNTHSISLKLECNLCNRVFKHQTSLATHKNTVHSGKLFACNWPGCQFTSRYKSSIEKHEPTHDTTQKRNYVCFWPECGKAFKMKDCFRAHMKIHTRTEVFECDWPGCQYTCKDKCYLNNHRSVHSSERKYVCDWPDCGKTFRSKSGFDEHMNTHTNEVRYSCDYPDCYYKTFRSSSLYIHKRIHKKKRIGMSMAQLITK